METAIERQAEEIVRELADAIVAPRAGECLPCYLDRVLRDVGCNETLRLAGRYRDTLAPRATALERRLAQGGGYCDCEVLMNVFWAHSEDVKPCLGAARGSTKPCGLWMRHRRGEPWF